jgi:hypothetical protein
MHMYDDRGLDVIASGKESLRTIYHAFNPWILDYDRGRIDQVFMSGQQAARNSFGRAAMQVILSI